MKLPVIIQHHPLGYTVEIPKEEFLKGLENAKHVSREDIISEIAKRNSDEVKKSGDIPERWRKPCKLYSGFVYGLDVTIGAEGDSIEEVLQLLQRKTTEAVRGFTKSAERDWYTGVTIHEIEI